MQMSRFIELKVLGKTAQMPKIDKGVYLLDYLFDMGFFNTKGDNPQPLNFSDIKAYLEITRLNLSYIEIKAILRLSRDFTMVWLESKDINYKAPFSV